MAVGTIEPTHDQFIDEAGGNGMRGCQGDRVIRVHMAS